MKILSNVQLKIGPTLRAVLKERRITLKEITKATGVPSSTVAEWTNNRAPKNPVQLKRVADFLGMSLEELLFDEHKAITHETSADATVASFFKQDVFSGVFEITVKRVRGKIS